MIKTFAVTPYVAQLSNIAPHKIILHLQWGFDRLGGALPTAC